MVEMSTYYAVHKGRTPGVYKTWKETQHEVSGFGGAVFKKFNSPEDANVFFKHGMVPVEEKRATLLRKPDQAPIENSASIDIYTDGSFSSASLRSGLGIAWDSPFEDYNVSQRLPDGTTNQEAELRAILVTLRLLNTIVKLQEVVTKGNCDIWTDSDYSCKCLSSYIKAWRENGWRTAKGDPVKHQ